MKTKTNAISLASLISVAGLGAPAAGQSWTQFDITVSTDGVHWFRTLDVNGLENHRVQVKAAVSYVRGDGTQTPVGFAYLTWQPTVSRWRATDSLLDFADRGNNLNGGSVPDTAGPDAPFGRITPFAATGPTSSDPYRGHVQTIDGVGYLRIARAGITNWVGDGPSTGSAASNNFNGSGGLACVQKSSGNVGVNDPSFDARLSGIAILKFAVDVDIEGASRTLRFDAPTQGMSRNSTTGVREAAWFASASDNFGQIKTPVLVDAAEIHVTPAPGVIAMLGLAGFVMGRRR